MSDNGNYILDLHFKDTISDPEQVSTPPSPLSISSSLTPLQPTGNFVHCANQVARELESIVGVVGHGLFLGMASEALISSNGGVRLLTR